MSKLTPLSYREVIKKARKAGFVLRRRTGGTHEIWWNEERRFVSVPFEVLLTKWISAARSF